MLAMKPNVFFSSITDGSLAGGGNNKVVHAHKQQRREKNEEEKKKSFNLYSSVDDHE
jgi:hypothetical protein